MEEEIKALKSRVLLLEIVCFLLFLLACGSILYYNNKLNNFKDVVFDEFNETWEDVGINRRISRVRTEYR